MSLRPDPAKDCRRGGCGRGCRSEEESYENHGVIFQVVIIRNTRLAENATEPLGIKGLHYFESGESRKRA